MADRAWKALELQSLESAAANDPTSESGFLLRKLNEVTIIGIYKGIYKGYF